MEGCCKAPTPEELPPEEADPQEVELDELQEVGRRAEPHWAAHREAEEPHDVLREELLVELVEPVEIRRLTVWEHV